MPSIHSYTSSLSGRMHFHEDVTTTIVNSTKEMELHHGCEQAKSTINTSNENTALIRDEIQSHNGDSSTISRTKSSVFASVSPFPCPDLQQEQCCSSTEQPTSIDNDMINLKESDANSTNMQPATRNASAVAVSVSVKEESPIVVATRVNTPGQIHVPIITSSSSSTVVEQSIPASHTKQIKKRKRIPNDPTATMNSSNENTTVTPDSLSSSSATSRVMSSYSRTGSTGRWTTQEHQAFVRGLGLYGREWKRVALDIPTRTSAQVRSHAQKYLSKMEKQLSLTQQQDDLGQLPSDHTNETTMTPKASKRSNDWTQNDFTITTDPSPATSRLGISNSQDNSETTSTIGDGSPSQQQHQQQQQQQQQQHDTENDYQMMSDSVRQQAARILANPTTVEQEVRDTISQLRVRYQQLQEQIQQQQEQQATTTSESRDGNVDQNRSLIWQRPNYGSQEHNNNISNNDSTNSTKGSTDNSNYNDISRIIDPRKDSHNTSSTSSTSASAQQEVLYTHHDDDELIALHVLQGLQKQQLRI